jgi:ribosomal protein S18 acetylase RimI-like enzyme
LAVTQILPLLHQQADYHHQLYPDYYQNVPDIDWSRYRQNTRRDITNAKNIHHFFRQNSHVSGLILGGIKYDRAYIWELVVDQSLRGQGVGTQLILRFIKSAQSRRAETIIVETGHNQPAIHLYQRLGFAPHQHIWFQNL